jgi:Holliday junction resolvase RusA-like endonuclease
MYTPKRTRDFEKLVADEAKAMKIETFTGPLSVYVTVQEEMPASWEHGKKLLAIHNMITPTRGDLDNKVKAITDALNGIAYFDDSQIAELKAVKRYASEHRIFVRITEIGLTPLQVEQALYSIKAQINGSGKSGIRRT